MERLTKRTEDGWISIKGSTTMFSDTERDTSPITNVIARLAVYEDIGTPEEIERVFDAYGRGMTLRTDMSERLNIIRDIHTDRLKELAQAEKSVRLAV